MPLVRRIDLKEMPQIYSNEEHLVVAVHQDDQWLILDNLHLQVSEETDYEPSYVLDDKGVY